MKYHYAIRTGAKNIKTRVYFLASAIALAVGGTGLALAYAGVANAASGSGFDQYGYNDTARIFVGTGSSWCQGTLGMTKDQCDTYMAPYQNDSLVMKWNAAWDACNAAGNDSAAACAGATLTNEWNGKVPGGSGDTEHFKAIWVGSAGESSSYWRPGGYLIWGNYEAVMDQGMSGGTHTWWAHATPNGFGVAH